MVDNIWLIIASTLFFGFGLIAGMIAWYKGYRPWFWLLSMPPIGFLVIALIPGLGRATTPEERERMESRADWTGGILSGFTLVPMFALPLIGAMLYFVLQSQPVVPLPMMSPTATVVTEESGTSESVMTEGTESTEQE